MFDAVKRQLGYSTPSCITGPHAQGEQVLPMNKALVRS